MDRIIHNRGQVAQENIDKVNAIIDEYGYKRNIFASNLAFNKKFKFAVLLPQYNDLEYWGVQMSGIKKAEKEFASYGVNLEYFLYDFDPISFNKMAQIVLESDFDGLLYAPVFYDEAIRFLKEFKKTEKPIVMIDSNIADSEGHAYVGQNAFKSGFLAGRLTSFAVKEERQVLIVKITRDIEATSVYLQRIDGFYSFFRENKHLTNFKFSEITINDSSLDQLDCAIFEGINSVFVPNSRAYIVAQFLEDNNIKGIRIIGYDLLDKNVEYLKKGVIDFLINQKPEDQGYMGINHLYKKLVLQEPVDETYYMPLEIIVKENYI
ncbi:substrate-binding domain-containing protein [Flavobacterium sp. NG2]|uniref:substrate-binding domain-containing protein n=1 Tax=Flavobacterium sp. NG2 TaxID=3097547 RepID=UPI002A8317A9|nr:substrate-binding domain-containing protein [Flavobacterium sp. NG2]WPR71155.1 substrate-binding domain-containing protein [Flavobacterium sp. NG2]